MTRHISTSLDQDLPLSHRVAIRTHLLYCTACRRFRKQALLLKNTLAALTPRQEQAETSPVFTLSATARERIKNSLSDS